MERDDISDQIRRDLRNLYCIGAAILRLKYMNDKLTGTERPDPESNGCDVNAIVAEKITELQKLQERYFPLIAQLSSVDIIICEDFLIRGLTSDEVGKELHYCGGNVRRRAYGIIREFAIKIKNEDENNGS